MSEPAVAPREFVFDPINASTIYLRAHSAIFRTQDLGQSWSALSTGLGAGSPEISGFVVTDGDSSATPELFAAVVPAPLVGNPPPGLFEFTDASQQWTFVSSPGAELNALITMPPAPPSSTLHRLFAGTERSSVFEWTETTVVLPAAAPTQSPSANVGGWNATDVTVTWNWKAGTFAIDTAQCAPSSTSSGEGALTLAATCSDVNGNQASASYTVNVDKTKPTATATAAPAPNANGWNNTSVTVSFSGADSGSGIASCSAPVVLSSEGTALSASGSCVDIAGNTSATATASGIKIDKTPPTISITKPANGASYAVGSTVLAAFACADSLSGVATCNGDVANGRVVDTTTAGAKTFTVQAVDKAGNPSTVTVRYSVFASYSFIGFSAPVANPPKVNVAAAGSTVPVKWSLQDPTGAYVADLGTFVSLTAQSTACGSTDTSNLIGTSTSSVSGLQYDSVNTQFIYSWKIPNNWKGTCRLLTLLLADGSTHTASFQLK